VSVAGRPSHSCRTGKEYSGKNVNVFDQSGQAAYQLGQPDYKFGLLAAIAVS
jgi:hypothetical protein